MTRDNTGLKKQNENLTAKIQTKSGLTKMIKIRKFDDNDKEE